jgi:hypothetical protein
MLSKRIHNNFLFYNDKFRFRLIEYKDIECIRNWRNEQKSVLRQNQIISEQEQEDYWNKEILPTFDLDEPNKLLFSMENLNTNELLAYGGFVDIDWNKKHAESSFLANTIYIENHKEYKILFINYLDFLMLVARKLKFSLIYSETYSFRKKHIEILEKYGYAQYGFIKKIAKSDNFSKLHQYSFK